MTTSKELATQEPKQPPAPLSGPSLVEYRNNRAMLLSIMSQEMRPGVDYGISPGTDRPALWKPGAEKLISMFAFAPSFVSQCEIHDDRHRTYTIKCTLRHRLTGTFLGDADAVCSTLETKYFKRRDGTLNNPADYYNTAVKMGGKRALIAAVLFTTAASDVFTQDLDDDEENAGRANGGAGARSGALSGAGRGVDTSGGPRAAAGLWRGSMATVTVKTYKDKEGKGQEYFILNLADGRSASTFDTKIAAVAREAKGKIVEIETVSGKKSGFFNATTFSVVTDTKQENPAQNSELEQGDEIPF